MHREVLFTFSPGDKRKNRGGYLRQEIEMKMCRGEQTRSAMLFGAFCSKAFLLMKFWCVPWEILAI